MSKPYDFNGDLIEEGDHVSFVGDEAHVGWVVEIFESNIKVEFPKGYCEVGFGVDVVIIEKGNSDEN